MLTSIKPISKINQTFSFQHAGPIEFPADEVYQPEKKQHLLKNWVEYSAVFSASTGYPKPKVDRPDAMKASKRWESISVHDTCRLFSIESQKIKDEASA